MNTRPPEDIRIAFTSADRYLEGYARVYLQHSRPHEYEVVYVILDTLVGLTHVWYGEEMATFTSGEVLEIIWVDGEEDNVATE